MYHPFELGQYWPESHYPKVQIFRKEQVIRVTIFLRSALHEKFQSFPLNWTYLWKPSESWMAYTFSHQLQREWIDTAEVRALNTLLSFCALEGNKSEVITDPRTAQIALVSAENPIGPNRMVGEYGLWASFAEPIFQLLRSLPDPGALEEYASSRMRGAHKIIAPLQKLSRTENEMHLYRSGNPLPVFRTFGNCACFSVTSNALDYGGGFTLSPHNVDSYSQQFLLMIGTLVFWQRMRKLIHMPS